jgi:hypothetical protein
MIRAAAPLALLPLLLASVASAQSNTLELSCSITGRADVNCEAVRSAIERELGVSVALNGTSNAPLRVTVDQAGSARVGVLTSEAPSESIERSVELPADGTRAVEVITWLTGNLARNEASALIAQYRERAAKEEAERAEVAAKAAREQAERAEAAAQAARAAADSKPKTAPAKPKPKAEPAPAKQAELPLSPVNLSLFHPLALYPDSDRRRFTFELGLAYGRLGALRGFGVELGVLTVLGPLDGVAFAPVIDGRGPTRGFTSSLFYTGGGDLTGLDLSFVSYRTGNVIGAVIATAFAGAKNVDGLLGSAGATLAADVRGGQFAVGANVARATEGVLAAAGANVADRVGGAAFAAGGNVVHDVKGLVAAGIFNFSGKLEGASLAAGANIAGDVNGAQIGVVNVARKVRGLQLGVVNVAEEVDGTALGVVSIAKNGEVQAMAYTSNHVPLHAAVKFRVGHGYSEIGAAYDPSDDTYAFEYGLGAHFGLGPITLEPGVMHSTVKPNGQSFDTGEPLEYLHYRARVGWRFAGHVELFAGGGVRHAAWGPTQGDVDPEVLAGVAVF